MQIDQAQYARITNPRIRQRTLTLPVRKGPLGNRIACPLRDGSVRELHARVPYDHHRRTAERQPTRARAVLDLIDLCDERRRTTKITVTGSPKIETIDGQDMYVVRFVKGDQAGTLDRAVFLAKSGSNYTFSPSRQAVPGDPEVSTPFVKDLERARREAGERRAAPQRAKVKQAAAGLTELQRDLKNMKARNLVRRAERNLEAAARALLSEEDVSSPEQVAPDGSRGEEDRPHTATCAVATLNAERPPSDLAVVSLGSAA